MKTLTIFSKKYGKLEALLDDEDYNKIKEDFKNMKWCVSKNRKSLYVQKRTDKGKVYLHRYIMKNPKGIVDHINHNTLDNRKENLRIVNNADNLRNGTVRANNTTGKSGVYFRKDRNKYIARIKVNYETINLGSFDTLEEAIEKRKTAEMKYWVVERR